MTTVVIADGGSCYLRRVLFVDAGNCADVVCYADAGNCC